MLSVTKTISLTGSTVIDNQQVCGYRAEITSDNPSNMVLSSWISNQSIRKANRDTCYADQKAFEDAAYALQDELLAALTTETDADTEAN